MAKHAIYSILITLSLRLATFAANLDWWEDASLYQLYPRSWKDGDGNGVGDLKGITEKLDYLKEIGVTATWLSPIFASPMADNGYDISNFTDIDPTFGTLDDFDALIRKAKKIGIKIILDFVPNHSSDECEWFQKSINREDGYDDFYVWEDGLDDPENPGKKLPPSNWVSIFDGPMWTWNEKRQQFYLHQFLEKQPDFNFKEPKVHEKMIEILKFWLDRGVDGFRIDAIHYTIEKQNPDGTYPNQDPSSVMYTQNQPETAELLYEWRDFLDSYTELNGGDTRILLAEAYSPMELISDYIGNGTHKGAHLSFNFKFYHLGKTTNARDVYNLTNIWMDSVWPKHKVANWLSGNHDWDRVATRVGKNRSDLVLFLLSALPGVTVTYYGEEIAMENVVICNNCPLLKARNTARTPFQWDDSVSAGFSSSNETWLPISDNYKTVNVKNELAASRSSLKVFMALMKLRNTPIFKAYKEEDGFSYEPLNDDVFQVIRRSAEGEYRILINWGNNVEQVSKLVYPSSVNGDLMEYVVVSQNSPNNIGDKKILGDITLMPYEAVALKKLYC